MNSENTEHDSPPEPQEEMMEQLASEQEKSIETELAEAKNAAEEFKGKYLRALADAENLRKRLQKEKQDLIQYAVQNVLLDFLPPIDHFENALKFAEQASPEVKHWAVGFEMILSQFKDILTNNGVVVMEALGVPFDHDQHEAIEMVYSTDHLPGTVVEVSMKGYKINDSSIEGYKVLRPARVKVAKNAPQNDESEANEINELNQQKQ